MYLNNMNNAAAAKDLDITAIAKLVRADIKAALADGTLAAGTVCSVRTSRYSMDQSLSVSINGFAEQVWTDEFVAHDGNSFFEGERRTAIAQSTVRVLERILDSYNTKNCDSQSDYYNVTFHGTVDFASDVTRADRAAVAARLAA
jgi:hypothetical protein